MNRTPLHPWLFALVLVLSTYAALPGSFEYRQLARTLEIVLLVTSAMFALSAALYRDVRKGALFVSVFIVVFVCYQQVHRPLELWRIAGFGPGRRRFVLPIVYAGLAYIAYRLHRTPRRLAAATTLANLVAIASLAWPIFALVTVEAHSKPSPPLPPVPHVTKAPSKPDIYYFVFDRYGNSETLRRYGYDNSEFYRYLESKGFYIARDSRSNYLKTVPSLASSLNGEYLDPIARAQGDDSSNWRPVLEWIRDHRLGRFLKSQGYRYVHVGSYFWPTRDNPMADLNINYFTFAPYAAWRLLDHPLVDPLSRILQTPLLDDRLQQWVRVRHETQDLLELFPQPGPKFVFVHVLVPHPPFVFNRDLTFVSRKLENERPIHENYVNQTVAANRIIRELFDALLTESPESIVVLQGDEGPYPSEMDGDDYNWHRAGAELLREKSGILNAYHLPGHHDVLYPSISPVNSFRVVLDTLWGTHLGLLPDRVYAHESELRPYHIVDITEKVGNHAPTF